jgi:hypothetical protein
MDRANVKGTKLYFIMGDGFQLYLGYFLPEFQGDNSFGFIELETTMSWLY